MKIFTVVGARPQFVKAAPLSKALAEAGAEEVLVHTGQHFDGDMSDIFFSELAIPTPKHNLGISGGTHGAMTGAMLEGIESKLIAESADAVVVYGDTNSTLAGALAAAKIHVPVVHIEAGLRSYNRKMPEEINRVIADQLSEVLLCPSRQAVENLKSEGIADNVYDVGDVMADVNRMVVQGLPPRPEVLEELALEPGGYLLLTLHRAENTDDPARLEGIVRALGQLETPIVFPIHPRSRMALERCGLVLGEHVRCISPVGYGKMMALLKHCRLVMTDSGGLQKEAYWLARPCVTLRDETEWTELVDCGWNKLTGADTEAIVSAATSFEAPADRPDLYGDGHAAAECVRVISKHFG